MFKKTNIRKVRKTNTQTHTHFCLFSILSRQVIFYSFFFCVKGRFYVVVHYVVQVLGWTTWTRSFSELRFFLKSFNELFETVGVLLLFIEPFISLQSFSSFVVSSDNKPFRNESLNCADNSNNLNSANIKSQTEKHKRETFYEHFYIHMHTTLHTNKKRHRLLVCMSTHELYNIMVNFCQL